MAEPARRHRRLRKITEAEAKAIGEAVLHARPPQAPWKQLVERFGLCRARLVQLRREAMLA